MLFTRILLFVATLLTAAVVALWQATGGDAYTKFTVVQRVERGDAEGDLLGGTGFYDGEPVVETVRRREFRLGMLPTPSELLDRHWLSVASLTGAIWALTLGAVWWKRRLRRERPAKTT